MVLYVARGRVPLALCLGISMYASMAFRNASVVRRNACTVSQQLLLLDAGVVGISLSVLECRFSARL